MSADYAELYCLSAFSFLRGASHPEELVERAADLGYRALAITDECSLAGIVRAHVAARARGLALIVGAEVRLDDGPTLVLLARDRSGYGELCATITQARRRAAKGHYRFVRADLDAGLPGCLALLVGSGQWTEDAHWLGARFPGCAWLGVSVQRGADDAPLAAAVRAAAAASGLPIVAVGAALMHVRRRQPLADVMTAIRLGTPLAAAGYALAANGERHLRSRVRLAALHPAAWLAESLVVAGHCRFSLDELRYSYPVDVVPPGLTPVQRLRRRVEEGACARWPEGVPAAVRAQLEHELAIIAELHYEPYFLTVDDVVAFARAQGILCQGRGSAANSAVCYALGITAVDPAHARLLFERFVSRERAEPPDIDVDFEHERREEVLQYLYRRYGRARAALAATVICYRWRSALRDVARAFGLEAGAVARLSRARVRWEADLSASTLRAAGFDPADPTLQRILERARELAGFPRHLSQHVGGMVIAQGALDRLVPIENAAMPARTVLQWDKDDLDALGLMKLDCLGLGMLSAIRRTFELLGAHRGRHLTLADVPREDPATYRMIQRADTVGVFQIESRAQMSMLPRLKPARFYDLVIEVAIVRPGPIQGQMVHPYLRRRQGLEAPDYPNEACRRVLERTLGVPLFQEQVIELSMIAAGFSAGEADQLRRSMAAWKRKGDIGELEARLLAGMRARGYADAFARRIIRQIEGFGEYGFPESHAASFAHLAYVSAWLKCHEPAAFFCSLLNSQPMGFYAPAQLLQDARRHGVEVRPVRIEASAWDCTLEPAGAAGLALRLGLRLVKGLAQDVVRRLVDARARAPFRDLDDAVRRAALDRRARDALVAADAFAELAGDRHQARWQALAVHDAPAPLAPAPAQEALPLLPVVTEGEALVADYASLGLTLGRHPLALLREALQRRGACRCADVQAGADGTRVHLIGLVVARQQPDSAHGTVFVTLEDETGSTNLIVWDRVKRRYRNAAAHARLLGVIGTLRREGEVVHLIAERLADHTALLGALTVRSRDFH